jgi:hypothetical protein
VPVTKGFTFKAGPPSPSRTVTVNDLRKIAKEVELHSYKNISIQPLVWKVYADDETFYVKGGDAFDKLMAELKLEGG